MDEDKKKKAQFIIQEREKAISFYFGETLKQLEKQVKDKEHLKMIQDNELFYNFFRKGFIDGGTFVLALTDKEQNESK